MEISAKTKWPFSVTSVEEPGVSAELKEMVPVGEQEPTGTQEEIKPDVEVEEDVPNSEVQPEVAVEEPTNEPVARDEVSENVNDLPEMLTSEQKNVDGSSQPDSKFKVRIKHVGIGPGKKELTFFEVVTMLQTRYDHATPSEIVYPQKGVWIYERDAQMRRHYKRNYPEFFSPKGDRQAAQKRQEQHTKASRIQEERRARGEVFSGRPTPIDISAYRERASG